MWTSAVVPSQEVSAPSWADLVGFPMMEPQGWASKAPQHPVLEKGGRPF
jgi:hypothetical protein